MGMKTTQTTSKNNFLKSSTLFTYVGSFAVYVSTRLKRASLYFLQRIRMIGDDTRLAVRYAIYRTYLAEQHINELYSFLKQRSPKGIEFLDGQ